MRYYVKRGRRNTIRNGRGKGAEGKGIGGKGGKEKGIKA
jgi:hypothetical protein